MNHEWSQGGDTWQGEKQLNVESTQCSACKGPSMLFMGDFVCWESCQVCGRKKLVGWSSCQSGMLYPSRMRAA